MKQERLREAEALASSVTEEINESFVGKRLKVLIDGESEDLPGYYVGRSYRSAYEIDGIAYLEDNKAQEGSFENVKFSEIIPPFDFKAVVL